MKIFTPIYVIYKLYIGLIFWSTLIVLYPFFVILLSRKQWFPAVFKLKRFWSRLFQILLFCPVVVDRKSTTIKGPYVICANHSSYIDTVFFFSIIPEYFLFIGKGELLRWPLFRIFFRKMDIPINRENLRASYQSMTLASEALQRGESVAIYPEGTVPLQSPRMGSFKNGAFKLAIENQVPILPVTWVTNYKIMSDPSQWTKPSLPGRSKVIIHEPIETKGMAASDLISLRKKVFKVIDAGLPRAYQKHNTSNEN